MHRKQIKTITIVFFSLVPPSDIQANLGTAYRSVIQQKRNHVGLCRIRVKMKSIHVFRLHKSETASNNSYSVTCVSQFLAYI